MTYTRIDLTNAATADLLPVFKTWLANAAPGDVSLYHDGYLAKEYGYAVAEALRRGVAKNAERIKDADLPEFWRLSRVALAAAESSLVHLVQVRVYTDRFKYYAIRAVPKPVKAASKRHMVRHMAEAA